MSPMPAERAKGRFANSAIQNEARAEARAVAVNRQNIGHCHEGGDAGDQFGFDVGTVLLQLKELFHTRSSFFNTNCLLAYHLNREIVNQNKWGETNFQEGGRGDCEKYGKMKAGKTLLKKRHLICIRIPML